MLGRIIGEIFKNYRIEPDLYHRAHTPRVACICIILENYAQSMTFTQAYRAERTCIMHSGHGRWVWLRWSTKMHYLCHLQAVPHNYTYTKIDRSVALTTRSGAQISRFGDIFVDNDDMTDYFTPCACVRGDNAPINVMPTPLPPPWSEGAWGNTGYLHGDLCKCPYIGALISVQFPQGVWNNSTRTNINKHPISFKSDLFCKKMFVLVPVCL